jgi:hypothetical protein
MPGSVTVSDVRESVIGKASMKSSKVAAPRKVTTPAKVAASSAAPKVAAATPSVAAATPSACERCIRRERQSAGQ